MQARAYLALLLTFVSRTHGHRVSGKFEFPLSGSELGPVPVTRGFLDETTNVFAFEKESGLLTARVRASSRTGRDLSSCFELALCDITRELARDAAFRSRPPYLTSDELRTRAGHISLCGTYAINPASTRCTAHNLSQENIIPAPDSSSVVFVTLVACTDCLSRENGNTWPAVSNNFSVSVIYDVHMRNERASRKQLGWDEDAYRFAPAIVAAAASAIFLAVVCAAVLGLVQGKRVPIVVGALALAAAYKAGTATVTAVAYARVAALGKPQQAFFKARIPLLFVDELLLAIVTLAMSTGSGLVPNSWILELRSTAFLIALGMYPP